MLKSASRPLVCIFISGLFLTTLAFSQDVAPASDIPETAQSEPTLTSPEKPVANAKEETLRDPFWPVGYLPRAKHSESASTAPKKEPIIEWPPLLLKGTSRKGNSYAAIIAGVGMVEEGEVISYKQGNLIFRWHISSITAKNVSYTKLDVRAAKE